MDQSQTQSKLIKVSWWHMLRVWCYLHKVVEHRNGSIYFGNTFTCQKGINTCTGWAFNGMEKEKKMS